MGWELRSGREQSGTGPQTKIAEAQKAGSPRLITL